MVSNEVFAGSGFFFFSRADAIHEGEGESKGLQKQFIEKEIGLSEFVQSYMEMRTLYHRRALLHLAAKTSAV